LTWGGRACAEVSKLSKSLKSHCRYQTANVVVVILAAWEHARQAEKPAGTGHGGEEQGNLTASGITRSQLSVASSRFSVYSSKGKNGGVEGERSVERLASRQHHKNRFHAPLPGFRLFCRLQAVGNCIAIRFVERLEESLRFLVCAQCRQKIVGKGLLGNRRQRSNGHPSSRHLFGPGLPPSSDPPGSAVLRVEC